MMIVGGAAVLVIAILATTIVVLRPWESRTPARPDAGATAAGRQDDKERESGAELSGALGWKVPAASSRERMGTSGALGSWATPTSFVRADDSAIGSWEAESGKPQWQLKPPAGGRFCGVSQESAGGAVALAYGLERESPYVKGVTSVECAAVVLVDLATGRSVWRAELTGTYTVTSLKRIGATLPRTMSLAVTGQAVVVAYEWSAVGLSLRDGAVRWEQKRLPAKGNGVSSCFFRDALAGKADAVLLATCDKDNPIAVLAVDPATGERRWRRDLTAAELGDDSPSGKWLLAADPIVVAVPGIQDSGRYIVLDDTGHVKSTIAQGGSYGNLDMRPVGLSGGGRPRYRALVTADTLVTATSATRVTGLRDTNSLVAFDLATGRPRWTKGLGEKNTAVPAVIDGDTVVAMRTGTYEDPPQAFRLALADGRGGPMGPAYDRELIFTPANCLYRFSGGRLFLVSNIDTKVGAVVLR
ncbi:outer membrane protein assembly factor BamB [Sphaerisporangium siamense]|uniref:Outer membrane protein assembly factor BamB n=2 Tax=Sphaerisporangium siamense TaxID=795645 RepID=A0A7W7DCQ7_9ACTN|nr:outer membrane protein assembly factor BamB [Sphaerisporangium siamense]